MLENKDIQEYLGYVETQDNQDYVRKQRYPRISWIC